MQDNVSVLIATILAVVIIVLFPIYNIATRQDSIANNMVVRATTNFVDEVRNKGYIEADEYANFLRELDKTGNTYEVELEVYKPTLLNASEIPGQEEYEEKYIIEYTNTIVADMGNTDLVNKEDSVINSNIYYLGDGYKFYVRVKNTNITQAQILLDRLLGGEAKDRIVVNYGGVVYSNEWAKGEGAETSGANITISRPMDYAGNEFKYEHITTTYDMLTGKENDIYGIAVRLRDTIPNGDKIRFLLTYRNVEAFEDDSGNKIISNTATAKAKRIRHIKKYFSSKNFSSDVLVQELKAEEKNGLWTYEYMITLSNIEYDFQNNPYLNAYVEVASGSAYTRSGELGLLKSKDFVIIYEETNLEIQYENKMYDKDNNLIVGAGRVEYIIVNIKINKPDADIESVKYAKGEQDQNYFGYNGTSIKDTYNSEEKYTFTVAENGKYTVYAKDKRGKTEAIVIDIKGLGSDRLKFVLNWKKNIDFDMHMKGSKDGTEVFHVYYNKLKHDSTSYGYVKLNKDNQEGGSSESDAEIIILERAAKDMIYTCYVYDFTGEKNAFYDKKPELKIYRGDSGKEVLIYDSKTDKTWSENNGYRYWYILSYDANTREVNFIDKYLNTDDYIEVDKEGGEE